MTGPDVLAWVEDALAEARDVAAAAVDRAEALVELRSLALERAAVLGVTVLTLEQLQAALGDEEIRARFTALAVRATVNEREPSRAA
jgi:hypothetical protein